MYKKENIILPNIFYVCVYILDCKNDCQKIRHDALENWVHTKYGQRLKRIKKFF